jgi:hypothetical protein
VTEATFDAYLWQTVEKKQNFIAQIMTSKSPLRSCEDVDESALSYAEIKALCAGDPRIKEKMDLDIDVARLRLLKADHKSQHYTLQDNLLKHYPEQIAAVTERIEGIGKDIAMYNEQTAKTGSMQTTLTPDSQDGGENAASAVGGFSPMTVLGVTHTERASAAKALLDACKSISDTKEKHIGTYLGFDMSVVFDSFRKEYRMTLKGSISHPVDLSKDAFGNISRINNMLRSMPERLEKSQKHLENIHTQIKDAQTELNRPFTQQSELAEKESRLALLNAELDIDGFAGETETPVNTQTEMVNDYRHIGKGKTSILDGLQAFNANSRPTDLSGRDRTDRTEI